MSVQYNRLKDTGVNQQGLGGRTPPRTVFRTLFLIKFVTIICISQTFLLLFYFC